MALCGRCREAIYVADPMYQTAMEAARAVRSWIIGAVQGHRGDG